MEVRAEQVLVAQPQHNKEVEELRAQVAALTAKTAELQTELRHQSTRAPRPKVCPFCRDSNPRSSDRESGVLTTELSLLPDVVQKCQATHML